MSAVGSSTSSNSVTGLSLTGSTVTSTPTGSTMTQSDFLQFPDPCHRQAGLFPGVELLGRRRQPADQ